MLDEARLMLTRETVSDADRWAASLTITPATRLFDTTAKELTIQVEAFYPTAGKAPDQATLSLALVDARGKKVASTPAAPLMVPGKVVLPLADLPAGDFTLRAEVSASADLATFEQGVSAVENLKARLAALVSSDTKLREKERTTDRESQRRLVLDLEALAAGKAFERSVPANRWLHEAEEASAAILAGKPYYGQKRPGDFSLVLATKAGNRVRLEAPPQAKEGKPLPLVVALHGAGGSENMFFDGYGAGLIRKLAAERGWLLVAPAVGLTSGFNGEMLAEIEKLYPVDRSRIFILGHSMGAAATMTAVSNEPKLYRAAAALGGSGTVKASDDLKKVPILVAVGNADFALTGAKALHDRLKKAEVATLELKEYPGVEHLTVVQLALRDVFAFFDRTLEK
jgi:predicted esterase